MKREILDYIEDIYQAIKELDEFTAGMDFNEFAGDRKTINAVIRSL